MVPRSSVRAYPGKAKMVPSAKKRALGLEYVPDQVRGIDAFCAAVQQAIQKNGGETSCRRKACRKRLRWGPLIVERVGMKLVLVPCQ